jgi:hypothetical protein
MKKSIKTVLLFLIIFISAFFMFQNNINAEYSGTGGTGSGSAVTIGGKGSWTAHFGFYIKVYNQNNIQKGSTIDIYTGSYNSDTLKGWITYDGTWNSHPEKLYDYLNIPYGNVSGDYSTLLSKINTTLNIGDYITIEPYTLINGKKYTFREISDSPNKEYICTDAKCDEYECAEYSKTCSKYECATYKCLSSTTSCNRYSTTQCATYSSTCKTYSTQCATYKCAKYKCSFSLFGACLSYSNTCQTYSTTECATYKCKEYKCATYKCLSSTTSCSKYSTTECATKKCVAYKNTNTCAVYSDTCKTYSTSECATTTAYDYYDWYSKPAILLSNAAKVGSNITVGNKTFTAPTTSCNVDSYSGKKFCGYSSDKNIGYGITVVRYEDIYKNGEIKISIKRNDTQQLIKTKDATFRISNSNGQKIIDVTTKLGVVEHSLEQGTYKIEEIVSPQGYNLSSAKTVYVNIVPNGITEQVFFYDTTCAVRLEELGSSPSPEDLINLYKMNPTYTNLLNFASPSCSKATCTANQLKNTLACLSGQEPLPTAFNENNLSCYDEAITNAFGNYVGFCSSYFNLTNNLGTSNFYGIAGQFLIKQDNNIFTIYNKDLNPVKINNQYIATSKSGKVCYILNGNTYDVTSNIKSNNVYFGDVDEDLQTDLLNSDVSVNLNTQNVLSRFTRYTYELIYNYKLSKQIYLEKITGKYSSTKTNKTTEDEMYGILSKFNSNSGYIPFSISYNGNMYTSNKCIYETKKEIIKYDKTSNGNIELEFRTIDTNNPFVNRNTKTNWCDQTGNCKSNNAKVQSIIKQSNNSYNQTGAGPKYKITLTPSDIKIIREYNKTVPYDNYLSIELDYKNKKIVRNSFLYSLETGTLNNKSLSNKLYNLNYK